MTCFPSYCKTYFENHHYTMDPEQTAVVQRIHEWLLSTQRWFFKPSQKGIYLHGPSGSGKTLIVNLLSTFLNPKTFRLHMKPLMMMLNQKGFEESLRLLHPYTYIIIDECELIDIADALYFKRFVETLIQNDKKYVLMTSNIMPQNLYKGGIHFDRFEPFIGFIKDHLLCLTLDHQIDYRFSPQLMKKEDRDAGTQSSLSTLSSLYVYDRVIPCVYQQPFYQFDFKDLCEMPLGPYHYQDLLIQDIPLHLINVPSFTHNNTDALRRFMVLVDLYYDAQKKLITTPGVISVSQDLPFSAQRLLSRLQELNH